MPLIKGKKARTRKGISENIRREKKAHPEMALKQALAIALSLAKEAGGILRGKPKRKKKTAQRKKTTRSKKR